MLLNHNAHVNIILFLQLSPCSLSPKKEVEFVYNDVRKGGPQMDGANTSQQQSQASASEEVSSLLNRHCRASRYCCIIIQMQACGPATSTSH